MGESEKPVYKFGPFVLNTRERVLLREGRSVPLKPKAYRVLLALVERSGHIVEKDYFMREVWDGSLREESNLPQQVSVLRRTLGDVDERNGTGKYIETIATRGYKFIATVRKVEWQGLNPAERNEPLEEAALEREPHEAQEDPMHHASLVLQRHTSITVTRSEPGHELGLGTRADQPTEIQTSPLAPASRYFRPLNFALGRRGKLLIAVLLCAGLAFIFFQLWSGRWARRTQVNVPPVVSPATTEIKSIAVLPFRARGQNAGNEYLEMGLAEAVAMKLGGISSVVVRPMSAVERELRVRGDDYLATGRALQADAVLEGSVQQVGDQVRVTAQLLRVSDGQQLWSGRFDEESAKVFRIQDSISEQLVGALQLNLGGSERDRLARRHTKNPEAYRLYLLGRYFWRSDASKSRNYYQQALAADSSYALAHAGLADTYVFGNVGAAAEAERHAREALRLDESLAEPHATLGFIQMFSRWQWDEAGREFKRALELNPHYATAHQWYAIYLACQGRTAEAVARMKQAVELDPLSPAINADLGQMHFFAGNVDEAVAACQRALESDPQYDFALLYLFYINARANRQTEAAEIYLRFMKKALPEGYEMLNPAYREGGLRSLLWRDIDVFVNYSRNPGSYNRVAEDYALLGEGDKAMDWLEKSVDSHNFFMAFIKVNPLFTDLHKEARFKMLVERVGLKL